MEALKPPDALDFESANLPDEWRKWKTSWEIYHLAEGVSEKDENIQCAIFKHVIGKVGQQMHSTFSFARTEENKLEPLIKKFEA